MMLIIIQQWTFAAASLELEAESGFKVMCKCTHARCCHLHEPGEEAGYGSAECDLCDCERFTPVIRCLCGHLQGEHIPDPNNPGSVGCTGPGCGCNYLEGDESHLVDFHMHYCLTCSRDWHCRDEACDVDRKLGHTPQGAVRPCVGCGKVTFF